MLTSTQITFYGGINEIGGNKFLVEDKGYRVFLDFGMQMGKSSMYFSDFLKPRIFNGMGDLFQFDLLPKLKGLYRKDYEKHMGFENSEQTNFDGILLTHAHVDHHAYIHYLRPDITIYCSEATKLILKAIQETGGGVNQEYVTVRDRFVIKETEEGPARDQTEPYSRNITTFKNKANFKIGSIEVEPIGVDHSLPGVTAFILHTSEGSVGYTADIRLHGRRPETSQEFAEQCKKSKIDVLLCEGTRITELSSESESSVELDVSNVIKDTNKLVVCTYPIRDLDRFYSFYNAATKLQRDLVIDVKQAYLLKLFQDSSLKGKYPGPDDKRIKIYIQKKNWGLIGRKNLPMRLIRQDYDEWEREFLSYDNTINYSDVRMQQNNLVFYCNDYQLDELIDIQPEQNSSYIRSSTEPFDEEMELDEQRVKRWITKFGLMWHYTHVSGHASGDQIKQIIETASAKKVIPIHTTNELYFKKWHDDVQQVQLGKSITI